MEKTPKMQWFCRGLYLDDYFTFFSLSASHFLYSYYRDDKKWKESLTHFKKDAHLDFVLHRQHQGIP